ncbi:hypothetical protein AKJ16_DCAP12436 [Drosera capensis]
MTNRVDSSDGSCSLIKVTSGLMGSRIRARGCWGRFVDDGWWRLMARDPGSPLAGFRSSRGGSGAGNRGVLGRQKLRLDLLPCAQLRVRTSSRTGGRLIAGALWYLFSVERIEACWRQACSQEGDHYSRDYLYCNNAFVLTKTYQAWINMSQAVLGKILLGQVILQGEDRRRQEAGMVVDGGGQDDGGRRWTRRWLVAGEKRRYGVK